MRLSTFKRGGVFPPGNKQLTDRLPIEEILPAEGEQLRFALAQHIGEPCEPIVKTGEQVFCGQKIADSGAALSAPLHSSVSGVVLGFTETMIPSGGTVSAIVIENDGEYNEYPIILPPVGINLTAAQILSKIREAGVVGLGGAGFPARVKLDAAMRSEIDCIIINAAECEPYLTVDHRLIIEEHEKIADGLKVLAQLFPSARRVLAIEFINESFVNKVKSIYENSHNLEVATLKPKYPQGYENQLVKACTGRDVPENGFPTDAGVLVHNAATVIAVGDAVLRTKPLTSRVITLSGGAIKRRGNYRVPIGLSFETILDRAGGFTEAPSKYIFGGPMMGSALHVTDVPVTKTSSGLLCLTKKESRLPKETNCIRCGKCISSCPIGLMPQILNKYAITGNEKMFQAKNGHSCITCGCCTYICPAKRHLTQSISAAKEIYSSEN